MTSSVVHCGDAVAVLRTLPTGSAHCCVTSPPYFSLRDYGVEGQYGLEPTIGGWLANMVATFREVRRVLRRDGTLFVNIGDGYHGSGRGARPHAERPKQRMAMPERLLLALIDDGWWYRDEIIWSKKSPMPEACVDRTSMAHEKLYLLTPSAKYFFDQEPIREPVTGNARPRCAVPTGWDTGDGTHQLKRGRYSARAEKEPKSTRANEALKGGHFLATRKPRSVWTLSSESFRGEHFATFPKKLPEKCILAGTSEGGCCAKCGAPRERIVQKGAPNLAHQRASGGNLFGEYHGSAKKDYKAAKAENASDVKRRILAGMRDRTTVGWRPRCSCAGLTGAIGGDESRPYASIPCTVLDPFTGSGTTGIVAARLGRDFVGIELNPKYAQMARDRIHADMPLFLNTKGER